MISSSERGKRWAERGSEAAGATFIDSISCSIFSAFVSSWWADDMVFWVPGERGWMEGGCLEE